MPGVIVMVKKKVKKVKKVKKGKKAKKTTKAKRPIKAMPAGRQARKGKKAIKAKRVIKAKKVKGEKVLGLVDHYFGHISVAAIRVKAPFQVGDVIHIKGHTTDFTQKIDSMQIEHESVVKVKKGDDIGIKVKDHVREHDVVYLAAEPKVQTQPQVAQKGLLIQPPMFPKVVPQKALPQSSPVIKTSQPPKPRAEKSQPSSYSNTKFLKF
jgi:putative protease